MINPCRSNLLIRSARRWKDQKNIFRSGWNVNNVPALVRYETTSDGGVREAGRLIEGEILDEQRLEKFLSAASN